LLKLALRGILDGNITDEDCKRLGMTRAEVEDLVRKYREVEKEDNKDYKELENSVKQAF